ncbi:hypothetical protein [Thermoleptolyngbya sp. M55_K2018_002]|nr:hypothetical protein [Thermoleptolyngbya sp. M55_K2018_002]HIK42519.1 hypothetical protein [Thermoleptolyngbya sp. M55_K2018_002]
MIHSKLGRRAIAQPICPKPVATPPFTNLYTQEAIALVSSSLWWEH